MQIVITEEYATDLRVSQWHARNFIYVFIWKNTHSFLGKNCTAKTEIAIIGQSEINPTKNWKLSFI